MNRVDHAPRFGSFAGSASLPLGSAKVGEDMLSRRHEVPDFRISRRSPSRWAVASAWLCGIWFAAACVYLPCAFAVTFYEIGCAIAHRIAFGRSDEARVSPLMDLQTGAGDAAPGDDLTGMGQPIKTKETK